MSNSIQGIKKEKLNSKHKSIQTKEVERKKNTKEHFHLCFANYKL